MASLEIARSNLAYPARILLFGLHALGTVFGLAYNSRTPDLYRNSSHHSLAWTLSAVAILESVLSIVRSLSRRHSYFRLKSASNASHEQEQQPLVSSSSRPYQDSNESLCDDQLHSDATGPTYDFPEFLREESRTNRINSMRDSDSHTRRFNFPFFSSHRAAIDGRHVRRGRFSWTNFKSWSKRIPASPSRFVPSVAFTSRFFVTVMIILAFVSFCTGIVTMAGIFVSRISISYHHWIYPLTNSFLLSMGKKSSMA